MRFSLRGFFGLAWLLLATTLAHAQPVVMAHGLASIPPSNLLIAAGLSFVGGLAWTSQKEAKSTVENKRLALTIIADLFGAVVAGVVAYFLAASATDSVMLQAAAITTAGYGGTRLLDVYLSEAIVWLKGFFTRKTS